ncbi:HlyD family efflux transporter periplasmic adaptor subunit [Psychromarinibacter sp. C21-152]|uniref:HlyD family efflux transporter periplasmic adaptor subunit n=1 Tax=Psychromarinibacter sediminicola TaxID=3033385 RepID=A0AAE3NWI9_9RHOB|nr:HlyD family efflux transporter periplasmic adaptor subunit [Psychromarinibacter sediminicola]MDF0603561.1 HlyD family efflux transporter periplasmic adaptor subunit [Psychromarinibacter sediminicola]
MARKKLSRPILILATLVVVGGGLALAFWPRPVMVDIGEVTRGAMRLTIDEEGRTRVAEDYVVSTPVNGRLLRVEVDPGDPVEKDKTVVARMRPANPAALDVRTREQASAAVEAAQAALLVAMANLRAAQADDELAQSDLERTARLAESGTASAAALERAEGAAEAAEARLLTAQAAIAQRKAELQSAQAQLIGFDDRGLREALDEQLGDEMPIHAPTDGVILRVINAGETTLPAGAPILEVGDIRNALEVVVELISADAVQVSAGDPVIIDNWGGPETLAGVVERIEPFGETKVSALGVEEQRVTIVVRLTSPPEERAGLGHGFRVEARIVVWQAEDAIIVPSSALFREDGGWAVLAVRDAVAALQPVEVGRDNGIRAQVLDGLAPGDRVVLYPPATLAPGSAVEQRVVE